MRDVDAALTALQDENQRLRRALERSERALEAAGLASQHDVAAGAADLAEAEAAAEDLNAASETLGLQVVALQNRATLIEGILKSSSDCIKVLDPEGALVFMSEGGQRVMEVDDIGRFIGCPWPEFWAGEGRTAAKAALDEARAGRIAQFQGQAPTAKGRDRWWDVVVSPIFGPDGEVAQLLSISRDVTELTEAHNRQRFLMEELSHRVKNTLTMVTAIANQTLRDISDRGAVDAFGARLRTLASAHDILLANEWASATIGRIVGEALRLHEGGKRFDADGPEIELGPRSALTLALLLHELATNAAKHGALTSAAGRVSLDWRLCKNAAEGPPTLALVWREHGGPAAVEPERRGFGSRLIGMGLTGGGDARLDFGADGLTATFSAPLAELKH